jgi:hypothetical protein
MKSKSFFFGGFPQDSFIPATHLLPFAVCARWRTFYNDQRTGECRNFIDGDLIETFLDFNPEQMQLAVDGTKWGTPLDTTVEDVIRLVEILVRIH